MVDSGKKITIRVADNLYYRIVQSCAESISISDFVRMAIEYKLETGSQMQEQGQDCKQADVYAQIVEKLQNDAAIERILAEKEIIQLRYEKELAELMTEVTRLNAENQNLKSQIEIQDLKSTIQKLQIENGAKQDCNNEQSMQY